MYLCGGMFVCTIRLRGSYTAIKKHFKTWSKYQAKYFNSPFLWFKSPLGKVEMKTEQLGLPSF